VTAARGSLPGWFVLTLLAALGANGLASATTRVTIELMRSPSPFAQHVREYDLVLLPCFQVVAFVVPTVALVGYLWPIVAWFRRGAIPPPGLLVQRRVISAPLVMAAGSFAGWMVGPIFFPTATLLRFGRWTPELASQHIVSPLVNGFLAVTTTYLLVDLIFRRQVVPRVFPEGRLTEVPGALALGVRGRLLVFLVAVAFVPLFTALGLVRAATARLDAGLPAASVMGGLARASEVTFAVYVAVGLVLTLLLARTFTGPLAEVTSALRRIRAGALDRDVRVSASDEVGVVEEGVNALLAALREKERILGTFGRIVEPAVRDRLLSGEVEAGGEVRRATVLFCDLRGFTALAERSSPVDLVTTLNEFFTVLTTWVRTCGGFVDKFLGDGLLVVFGLFDDGDDSGAASAVRCARGMHTRVAELNGVRAGTGRPPLAVSIGIHSGPVVAGTIGAAERHDYTVVGDTVNVAARLQEVCREHEHALLVSGTTHDLAARGGTCGDVLARYAIRLRGRDAAVDALALGCS
jgi:adenylate cyclase